MQNIEQTCTHVFTITGNMVSFWLNASHAFVRTCERYV